MLSKDSFVVEEQREPGTPHRAGVPSGTEPTDLLAALAEIRREVQRRPADEWEAGLLIRLYAETISLQAKSPPLAELTPDSESRYSFGLSYYLPKLIIDVAEAMIRRHYPDTPEEFSAGLTGDGPSFAARVNHLAEQMPDGRAMLAVWLMRRENPKSFRRKLSAKGQQATLDFVDACAALARDILADGGSMTKAFTVGLTANSPDQAEDD
jgi:hypothetical protein